MEASLMKDDLITLIIEMAREILEAEGGTGESLGKDTRLFGKEGLFDSMGLVALIVAVEQGIEDRHGASVALADERALSQSSSPYRTIETLADYAVAALGAAG